MTKRTYERCPTHTGGSHAQKVNEDLVLVYIQGMIWLNATFVQEDHRTHQADLLRHNMLAANMGEGPLSQISVKQLNPTTGNYLLKHDEHFCCGLISKGQAVASCR